MERIYDSFESDFGDIYVVLREGKIEKIFLDDKQWEDYRKKEQAIKRDKEKCNEVIKILKDYLKGHIKEFNLDLYIEGTEFQKSVWSELLKIPYGEVVSYSYIAEKIGKPKAVRAIGGANKNNPIPIIIPCHRVINKDGSLGGYMGTNTALKKYLLKLEGYIK